ncbi:uncharacterized protein LOC112574796 [Pomacea canaliculata]|uniref:uncharacterized protein LOC112574796 n=1 Tax=Pomacea canaliculata TaxID=400727 RepID=UPI000D73207A|nr:uncharacterized protein LOC112574796 [Pomacea canaliculata]
MVKRKKGAGGGGEDSGGGGRVKVYLHAVTNDEAARLTDNGNTRPLQEVKKQSRASEVQFYQNQSVTDMKIIIIRGTPQQIENAVSLINQKTGSKETISDQAQKFWLQWVQEAFPDLDSRAYFLPPVYFNRVPMTPGSVGGQDVLILNTQHGQSSKSNQPTPHEGVGGSSEQELPRHACVDIQPSPPDDEYQDTQPTLPGQTSQCIQPTPAEESRISSHRTPPGHFSQVSQLAPDHKAGCSNYMAPQEQAGNHILEASPRQCIQLTLPGEVSHYNEKSNKHNDQFIQTPTGQDHQYIQTSQPKQTGQYNQLTQPGKTDQHIQSGQPVHTSQYEQTKSNKQGGQYLQSYPSGMTGQFSQTMKSVQYIHDIQETSLGLTSQYKPTLLGQGQYNNVPHAHAYQYSQTTSIGQAGQYMHRTPRGETYQHSQTIQCGLTSQYMLTTPPRPADQDVLSPPGLTGDYIQTPPEPTGHDIQTKAHGQSGECIFPTPHEQTSQRIELEAASSDVVQPSAHRPAKVLDSDVRDDEAKQRVLVCLQEFSERNKEVLFGMSKLAFGDYLGEPVYAAAAAQLPPRANLPSALPRNWKQGDFDVLLIHRHYGFVVCKVRAFGDITQALNMSQQDIENNIREKLRDAVSQLDKAEAMLSHLVSDIASGLRITKTIAFPNLTASQVQQAICEDIPLTEDLCRCLGTSDPADITGLCLCCDQLSDPKTPCDVSSHVLRELGHWWQRRVAVAGPDSHMTDVVYKMLVARKHIKTFCEKLLAQVPRLHLWAASCYNKNCPPSWQVEHLTRPLRSPPAVVREIKKDSVIIKGVSIQKYSERGVPDHTDGPPVTRLYHRGQDHSVYWPDDCITCGREVAKFLHSLRVGVTENNELTTVNTVTSTTGGTTPCLQWRDVLVLNWYIVFDQSGVVTGLREAGIPVRVMKDDDIEDVATARSDVVWVADGHHVRGLERKVVVCLVSHYGSRSNVSHASGGFHSISRCTSQLVTVE